MAFDRLKVTRTAEKFLANGKISAAIAEYRKIVENEPDDLTSLNLLGDLLVRTGDETEAVAMFRRIADHYRTQGFNLKAIAMYKKIDRLQPRDPEVAFYLANLYEAQGLFVEARAQFLVVAEAYTNLGQADRTLEVLHRIADLDPQNVETRIKLAEGYLKEEMPLEASQAFMQAGTHLAARGSFERAVGVFNRALDLMPFDQATWSGLVNAHIALGSADEAAGALERVVAAHEGDAELYSVLAQAHIAAENAFAAERAVTELVKVESASYLRFLEVAQLYLTNGDHEGCVNIMERLVEETLSLHNEAGVTRVLAVLEEMLARDPDDLAALRMQVRIYKWQHDEQRLRATLERLAEAAATVGAADDERDALARLVNLAPDVERYRERLAELGGASDSLINAEDIVRPVAEEMAVDYSAYESLAEDSGAPPAEDYAPATEYAAEYASFEDADAAENSASPDSENAENFAAGFDAIAAEGATSVIAFHEEAGVADAAAETSAEHFAAENAPEQNAAHLTPQQAELLLQELSSVDFYVEQGYFDIARDTLDMLERQYGANAEITARRERLAHAEPAPAPFDLSAVAADDAVFPDPANGMSDTAFEITSETFTAQNGADEPAAATGDNQFSDAEELHEIDFSSQEVFAVEPTDDSDADADFAAPTETGNGATDFAFEFVSQPELTVTGIDGEAAEQISAAEPPALDPGLSEIFDEFKTAVEEETQMAADGDYETHYNLGLAYKEMDLMDEAVEEFQLAARLAASENTSERYFQCCTLLGHCFMQKSLPRVAIMWFKKALKTEDLNDEEIQALRYEIGLAYEEMGDTANAIDAFTEVYGMSVTYRGVADKLRELQSTQMAH